MSNNRSDSTLNIYPVIVGQTWYRKEPTGNFTDVIKIDGIGDHGIIVKSESGTKLPISFEYLYDHYYRRLPLIEGVNNVK